MTTPLEGITILDTSERSPAAAIAGMLLSDLGAKVIRVEPEGGDPLRQLDAHKVWLRGQESIAVGKEPSWTEDWAGLRDCADVILHTAQPRQAKPDLLSGWVPRPGQVLAVLTATPRRTTDARRQEPSDQPAYGELIEAQYGLFDDQQGHRDGPIFLGWPLASYGAAWLLTLGILAAIVDPDTKRRGEVVTTSLFDGVAFLMVGRWGAGPGQAPLALGRYVGGLIECGDGEWVVVHSMARGAFDRIMHIIGREDLVDPTITDLFAAMDPDVAEQMREDVKKTFLSAPAQHWFEVLSDADVPCMVANPAGRALEIEQYAINGLSIRGPD